MGSPTSVYWTCKPPPSEKAPVRDPLYSSRTRSCGCFGRIDPQSSNASRGDLHGVTVYLKRLELGIVRPHPWWSSKKVYLTCDNVRGLGNVGVFTHVIFQNPQDLRHVTRKNIFILLGTSVLHLRSYMDTSRTPGVAVHEKSRDVSTMGWYTPSLHLLIKNHAAQGPTLLSSSENTSERRS